MGHDGADGIIQLVANLYKEQASVVRTTNGDTDLFKIERGVRQGCVISTGLYNIHSEHIMQCVMEEHHDGITIGGRRETKLRCADDTTLLCTSKEELLGLLKRSNKPACPKTFCLTHKIQRSFLTFLTFRDHLHFFVGQSLPSSSSNVCFQSCQLSVRI